MINKKAIVISATFLLFADTVGAAVYKTVDDQGNVVYTDDPAGNGDPVNLPPLSTVSPPRTLSAPDNSAGNDSGKAASGYRELTIKTPAPDETLRDNTGDVRVSVNVTPPLNASAGDRMQFFLDGQTFGEPAVADEMLMPNLDRGAHTVSAAVVGPSGNTIKRSDEVRFYLHRQSVNFPRGPVKPTPHVNR